MLFLMTIQLCVAIEDPKVFILTRCFSYCGYKPPSLEFLPHPSPPGYEPEIDPGFYDSKRASEEKYPSQELWTELMLDHDIRDSGRFEDVARDYITYEKTMITDRL